eukprot:535677-Pyramimonas_sp.AAC.1
MLGLLTLPPMRCQPSPRFPSSTRAEPRATRMPVPEAPRGMRGSRGFRAQCRLLLADGAPRCRRRPSSSRPWPSCPTWRG